MLSTLILSVKHHGGKSTALKGDMQKGGDFFADWQSAEKEEARTITDGSVEPCLNDIQTI